MHTENKSPQMGYRLQSSDSAMVGHLLDAAAIAATRLGKFLKKRGPLEIIIDLPIGFPINNMDV